MNLLQVWFLKHLLSVSNGLLNRISFLIRCLHISIDFRSDWSDWSWKEQPLASLWSILLLILDCTSNSSRHKYKKSIKKSLLGQIEPQRNNLFLLASLQRIKCLTLNCTSNSSRHSLEEEIENTTTKNSFTRYTRWQLEYNAWHPWYVKGKQSQYHLADQLFKKSHWRATASRSIAMQILSIYICQMALRIVL